MTVAFDESPRPGGGCRSGDGCGSGGVSGVEAALGMVLAGSPSQGRVPLLWLPDSSLRGVTGEMLHSQQGASEPTDIGSQHAVFAEGIEILACDIAVLQPRCAAKPHLVISSPDGCLAGA